MRYFFHISEFGHDGFRHLPGLTTIADDLVLWAPAGSQIEEAKDAGISPLGAEDLLALIESKRVRIVGRQYWLTDKNSRSGGWKLARWSDSFDGEIARMAEKDSEKGKDERRVFFAEQEGGWKWAQEQISSASPHVDQIEKMITQPGALDLKRTDLLPGMAEKLARISSREERLLLALRDIRNHTAAASDVDANIAIEPEVFRDLAGEVAPRDPQLGPRSALPNFESVCEVLEVVTALAPIGTPVDLKNYLALPELPQIRGLVNDLLRFNAMPKKSIEADLAAAPELEEWWNSVVRPPDMPFGVISELLLGVILALLTEQVMGAAVGSAVGAGSIPATRLGYGAFKATRARRDRKANALRPIGGYAGSKLPFILAYGTDTPTYGQVGEIRRRLREAGPSLFAGLGR